MGRKGPSFQELRHRAWILRGAPGAEPNSWRPRTLHRVPAKRVLTYMDAQIRITTGLSGFKAFVKEGGGEPWTDWRKWPHVGVAMDLGSDQNATMHFLLYGLKAKASMIPDGSHAAHRDMVMLLRRMDLYPFWVFMLVSWNLPHGPFQDDLRYAQLRQAMKDVYEKCSPHENVLYQEFFPIIARDFAAAGIELPGVEDPLLEVWALLKEREAMRGKGRSCNMNRFMGVVEEPERRLPHWGVDLWERTHVALELDFMKGKGLAERIKVRCAAADEGGQAAGRTSQGISNVEDKTLRSCSQNACTISVMMLSNPAHSRMVRAVLASASSLRRWHAEQNLQLRSAAGSLEWLRRQAQGGYFVHLNDAMKNLEDVAWLEKSEFMLGEPRDDQQINDDVYTDDEFADLQGQAAIVLAGLRVRRGLWLVRGWPYSLYRCLGSAEDCEKCIDQFMNDVENYAKLQGFGEQGAAIKKLLKRCIMQLTAVEQFRLAFDESNGAMTPDIRDLLQRRGRGISGPRPSRTSTMHSPTAARCGGRSASADPRGRWHRLWSPTS